MSHAATLERAAFAPPPTPGLIRALLLALAAHGLLLLLLTAGVQWHREVTVVAEAEIWSAVPEFAAPPLPPPDTPEPVAETPPPRVVETPPTPAPDIALERERERKRKELLAQQEKAEQLKKQKLEQEKLAKEKLEKEKLAKAKAEKERLEKEKLAKAKPQVDPKAAAAEAKKLEEMRLQNLKRMAGLAGNTNPNATGSAATASGPSAGYAGRIAARIKPNIVFTEIDSVSGNPMAEVEVRSTSDGTILSRRLVKSSGVKAFDEAVLRAIDKTEMLPRDVDGKVPTMMTLGFRPRD